MMTSQKSCKVTCGDTVERDSRRQVLSFRPTDGKLLDLPHIVLYVNPMNRIIRLDPVLQTPRQNLTCGSSFAQRRCANAQVLQS